MGTFLGPLGKGSIFTNKGIFGLAPVSAGIWTPQTSSFGTTIINGVGFGGGTWVAVGAAGKLATSTDNGVTWTQRANPFGATWQFLDVTYGAGTFVAVGRDNLGNGQGIYSTDLGLTWNLSGSLGSGTPILNKIAFLPGPGLGFLAITQSTGAGLGPPGFQSSDGTNFISNPFPWFDSTTMAMFDIISDGTNYVITVFDTTGAAFDQIAFSPDGNAATLYNLTTYPIAGANSGLSVAFNPAAPMYVTMGDPNSMNVPNIESSPGTPWAGTQRNSTLPANGDSFSSCAFGSGLFVGVTYGSEVVSSPDGINYSIENLHFSGNTCFDVAYGNGIFMACGSNGKLSTRS